MRGAKQTLSSARTGAGRDDWQTPSKVLDVVRRFGHIALDACTAPDNPVGADHFYTEADDGLSSSWQFSGRSSLVWCNPPYSTAKHWIGKAVAEAELGAEVIMLIASRTGAKYFRPVFDADALCFISGRLTFLDADTGEPARDGKGRPMPAPFDSALVYWGKRPARARRHLAELGLVLYPREGQGGTHAKSKRDRKF